MRGFKVERLLPLMLCALAAGCAGLPRVEVSMPRGRTPFMGGAGSGAPAGAPRAFDNIAYSDWSDSEPPYRFYPGDKIDIRSPTDPTLNKNSLIGLDGRISMDWIPQVMVAGRSVEEIQASLRTAYATAGMRQPVFTVSLDTAAPLKVYVGGEVNNPGVIDITGDANALQAVIQAGSWKNTASVRSVVILRRQESGLTQRVVNLSPNGGASARDLVPLRRGDIVFVPKSAIGELSTWMTQFRDALPIQFGYTLNGF